MSVEALAICAVVDEGAPALRALYAAGVTAQDLVIYDPEFAWIERRLVSKLTLNRRVFSQRFPDFEWMPPSESTKDLAMELKEERAFEEVNTLIASLSERLERDNAIDLANEAREHLSMITRL